MPWWYSVDQMKYEDHSQPICKARLGTKQYIFPQPHQKIDSKEIQQFYVKQVAFDRERIKADFLQAFRSLIWITYRKDFTSIKSLPSIPKQHHFTSDSGWGCMIRSGQMLLSNSILRHLFSSDFSLTLLDSNMDARVKYASLMWQFMDNLAGSEAAFSIGNIVEVGLKYGTKPKDWYGPSTVIQILDELNQKYAPFENIKTAAFPEGVIYKNEILSRATGVSVPEIDKMDPTAPELRKRWKNAVVVMVGFRLGLDTVNPEHYPGIFRMFELPHTTGMVGGQGRGALYFVGYQERELIFLDPHVTQPAVPKVGDLWTEHLSYHFNTPLRLPVEKLDTCIAYG